MSEYNQLYIRFDKGKWLALLIELSSEFEWLYQCLPYLNLSLQDKVLREQNQDLLDNLAKSLVS